MARQQRFRDIEKLGMDYVMNRDAILKARGLSPLFAAEEYERSRRLAVKLELPEREVSPNGPKVEELLKTKSVPEVINQFLEKYKEDDYPPMFQELAVQDEENIEMQKLSALFEQECQRLAVDFLKRHADQVSRKALIGFAGANVCDEVFNRMFEQRK